MIQFRTYLRAELGKLRNNGDAQALTENVPSEVLKDCCLPTDADAIIAMMSTQKDVDGFVESLSNEKMWRLAAACSKWRNNGVYKKLQSLETWQEDCVQVQYIKLQQAEPELGNLFRALDCSLLKIANDPQILVSRPYCKYPDNRDVEFPTCLAIKSGATYYIFDGIHRAIQLVRNGRNTILLCYAEKE